MRDFEEFYRSNVSMVYAVACCRAGEAAGAHDLTQETFLRAWREYARIRDRAPAAKRAWLLTTLRNLSTDLWRRHELERWTPAAPISLPGQPDLRIDVLRALSELSDVDRELAVLRFLLDMNSREIGEALDMPEGTVRRRLAGCRKQLAVRLGSWAPERQRHEGGRH